MIPRLTATDDLPATVACPDYRREEHGAGIVHIGLGAFLKAHPAVYTDDALAAAGGDWRIIGVSLRNPRSAEELTPQDCLFTTIERDISGSRARVIGALAGAYCFATDRQPVLAALTSPSTKIVSITVTEKGYGIDRRTGGVDTGHPAIAADLADPENPTGVAGLLVWALCQRKAAGTPPFAVLCCDNLPNNGPMVRGLLVDFARRAAPDIAEHIATDVAFPATMVDRITPAQTAETLGLAQNLTGLRDEAAIECETFRQWVIEDKFPCGRPTWEAGGALFVDDVQPFEEMKLRMLNGTHSMLAYVGFLSGHKYVRDVMQNAVPARLVRRHLSAAAATLEEVPGMDLEAYASVLAGRFENPHLGHETYQIAMDGSEKLPQRILAPALDAQDAGQPLDAFAFATAAWMRFTLGRTDDGDTYSLRDPREAEILAALDGANEAEDICARLLALPGLFPDALRQDGAWIAGVSNRLEVMLTHGMHMSNEYEIKD